MPVFRNTTRDTVLAERGVWAATFLSRGLGLMFRGSFPAGEGLFIVPCTSIHMMFVFFPIDVIFVNREFRVVSLKRRVLPFVGLAFGGRGAWAVVELPGGTIEASGTQVGDQLHLR